MSEQVDRNMSDASRRHPFLSGSDSIEVEIRSVRVRSAYHRFSKHASEANASCQCLDAHLIWNTGRPHPV